MPRQSTANPSSGTLSGGAPRSSASSSGMRRRTTTSSSSSSSSGRQVGRSVGGSTAGVLRFYTDDAPGLKIGPTTVLVLSLMFVGIVVLLHVWGKFRS